MQKSGIVLISSGVAIAVGLILVVVGSQVILEDIIQGEGQVRTGEPLEISINMDPDKTSVGVVVVQAVEPDPEVTIHATVIDPFGSEVTNMQVSEKLAEELFDVDIQGEYMLIVKNEGVDQVQVFGAIGPQPDATQTALAFGPMYVLIAGMIGLVGVAAYTITGKLRRK